MSPIHIAGLTINERETRAWIADNRLQTRRRLSRFAAALLFQTTPPNCCSQTTFERAD